VSIFKDEIREISGGLRALDYRVGQYPLTAEDAYLCAC